MRDRIRAVTHPGVFVTKRAAALQLASVPWRTRNGRVTRPCTVVSRPLHHPIFPSPLRLSSQTTDTMPHRWLLLAPLLALSLLPVSDWIGGLGVGGFGVSAAWGDRWFRWIAGAGAVVAVGWAYATLAQAWRSRGAPETPPQPEPSAHTFILAATALGLASFGAYCGLALFAFDGLPLHVDALTQAIHSKLLAQGALATPARPHPEFFNSLLWVDGAAASYSQFPPGWPALRALGVLFGSPWIVAPACGALGLLATVSLVRGLDGTRAESLSAGVIAGCAPLWAVHSATQMNHIATALWIVAGCSALVWSGKTTREKDNGPAAGRGRSFGLAVLGGLALGFATLTRPLDGAAFASVWALALSVAAVRARSTRGAQLIGLVLGLAGPALLLLAYNTALSGSPLVFGYEAQWGASHGLGFHEAPWGPPHTPSRGIALLAGYLVGLQEGIFGPWVPALLVPVVAIALAPRLSLEDRALLGGAGALLVGYFAYWHRGEYLGPRFLVPLVPFVALWASRVSRHLAARGRSRFASDLGSGALAAAVLIAVLSGTPELAQAGRSAYEARRVDVTRLVERAGAEGGLVFVPSAWGAQVVSRMKGRGLTPRQAQWSYERSDICRLDFALSQLESRRDRTPRSTLRAIEPLTRDSARLVASTLSPDTTQRMMEGADYPPACRARADFERLGTWSLLPFQAAQEPRGALFARDLHEHNRLLLEQYPDRPVFVVRPGPTGGLSRPKLVPLDLDSARAVWTLWDQAAGRSSDIVTQDR